MSLDPPLSKQVVLPGGARLGCLTLTGKCQPITIHTKESQRSQTQVISPWSCLKIPWVWRTCTSGTRLMVTCATCTNNRGSLPLNFATLLGLLANHQDLKKSPLPHHGGGYQKICHPVMRMRAMMNQPFRMAIAILPVMTQVQRGTIILQVCVLLAFNFRKPDLLEP